MAATTKAELLAVTEKEFEKLSGLIDDIESDTAESKDDDDTSIKDVIAHRAHWIDLFLGWYKDGQAGREVFFPAEGYKWNDLKRYNADLRAKQAGVTWGESQKALLKAHRRLTKFVISLSEVDLYGGPMAGANNTWTPGRWAEAAGPSHYRSAAKYVRARLRA
ncbi:MAG: ClbS/DfsB family four-helix bundle protein [Acidimicrobiales bacterium]|nr:ClbS/DfsB family four-helix bundle protein [Acidimicrobiales bacterium]RZV45242.1 MAG: ClbS/DfsB family four-helix bundle protein [Acidimicrobiales bacterium]